MDELKKVCDEYLLALSSGKFDYCGDDWTEHASSIVSAALKLVHGECILEVEQALLNYAEFGKLQQE